MQSSSRYIEKYILDDLKKKMVFISGPRQCGKTTLVKGLIKNKQSLYLNWDDVQGRKKITQQAWTDEDEFIAFDEIHKYSRWKNWLKGVFDTQKEKHKFIITGSARLDLYKKGQDSMLGRFFSYRLHPLCLAELTHEFKIESKNLLSNLLEFGGFPEPFFSEDATFVKRWRLERIHLIFRQDIQEIAHIRDINLLEMFYNSLTERVTSEISLNNIARDLEIAPKTAKAWLALLENTYTLFSISPYSKNITKAVTKYPKVYFYDNGEVQGDIGAKIENLVANHLYKKVHFLQDITGDRYELSYIRDNNGHEVDFVILKNRKPEILIEVKSGKESREKSLYYFKEKLKPKKCIQLVENPKEEGTRNGISVFDLEKWLSRELEEEF